MQEFNYATCYYSFIKRRKINNASECPHIWYMYMLDIHPQY